MSGLESEAEGSGQWLTAQGNRSLKKPTDRKRKKISGTAAKVLSKAVRNFGVNQAQWSWYPHSPETNKRLRRTKQTKMERFLKPARGRKNAEILEDEIESVAVKKPAGPISLKRRRQPTSSSGEGLLHDRDYRG